MGFADWSTTAGSNTTVGGVSIAENAVMSNMNNGQRAIMADARAALATGPTDVASATTTDLGAVAASYVRITGTTTITGFGTISAGIWKFIRFAAALTLTHNAASLIIPGAANIVTVAGDTAIAVSEGSGNWRVLHYQRGVAGGYGGRLVQQVSTQTGAVATGTTEIPYDDTAPQNTEGIEFMTLAITPTASANKLVIEVTALLAHSVGNTVMLAGLFQDSTAGALAAAGQDCQTAGRLIQIKFTHIMDAGTTSATTFKLRAGAGSGAGGTTTFNGHTSGRIFGGVMASSIVIREVVP